MIDADGDTEMNPLPTRSQAYEVAALATAIVHEDPIESTHRMDRGWFEILSLTVIDAVITRDTATLDQINDLLHRAHCHVVRCETAPEQRISSRTDLPDPDLAESRLEIAMEFVRSAQRRIAPFTEATKIRGTNGERFLRVVSEHPLCNSRTICAELARLGNATGGSTQPFNEGQLSRIGKKLRADGLVFSVRWRGGLAWDLTPRGRSVLDTLDAATGSTVASSPAVTIPDNPEVVVSTIRSSLGGRPADNRTSVGR